MIVVKSGPEIVIAVGMMDINYYHVMAIVLKLLPFILTIVTIISDCRKSLFVAIVVINKNYYMWQLIIQTVYLYTIVTIHL